MARPTLYRPEYCDTAIELGALGKSKAQISTAIGVSRRVIDDWCAVHPEFLLAIAHARDLALTWWEDQGQAGLWFSPEGEKLNPQLWSRSMAARFPDDYRESNKVEVTGKDGGAIQVDDAGAATKLAKLLAAAQARKGSTARDQGEVDTTDLI